MNQRQRPEIEHLHWNGKPIVRRRLFRIRDTFFQMDGMTDVLLSSKTETVTSLCLIRFKKIPETIHHHPSQTHKLCIRPQNISVWKQTDIEISTPQTSGNATCSQDMHCNLSMTHYNVVGHGSRLIRALAL